MPPIANADGRFSAIGRSRSFVLLDACVHRVSSLFPQKNRSVMRILSPGSTGTSLAMGRLASGSPSRTTTAKRLVGAVAEAAGHGDGVAQHQAGLVLELAAALDLAVEVDRAVIEDLDSDARVLEVAVGQPARDGVAELRDGQAARRNLAGQGSGTWPTALTSTVPERFSSPKTVTFSLSPMPRR